RVRRSGGGHRRSADAEDPLPRQAGRRAGQGQADGEGPARLSGPFGPANASRSVRDRGRTYRIPSPPGGVRRWGSWCSCGPPPDRCQSVRMVFGAHVVLYSSDADADRAFLGEVFGFDSTDAGGGWLIFGLPPAEVAVHPAESHGSEL